MQAFNWMLGADGELIPIYDDAAMARWGEWALGDNAMANRRVARDMVGATEVSTVFTGIDQGIPMGNPPLIYETMIFPQGNVRDGETYGRCRTRDDALAMHAAAVASLRGNGA